MSLSTLSFHRLTYVEDGDDVVVGRTDIDSYAVLPPDGAELLRRLAGGAAPGAAADWYRAEYGEDVDMADFLDAMREFGFVRQEGEEPAGGEEPAPGDERPVRWQRLGRAMFSPAAWVLYAAVLGGAVWACLAQPELAPRHGHVFFTDSLIVIELTILLVQTPLTLVHELFHVLAGRRLGLRSRVRLSNRLYFVVFETVLDGLVAVPRRQRYLPMLAGLLADALVVALATLTAWALLGPAADLPGAGLAAGLALAIAFTTLPRMAWQGYFFLRTDLYHLVSTVLGCYDLHGAARQQIRNTANRWLRRPDRVVSMDAYHERDQRAARWYGPLVVTGYALAAAVLVIVMVPITWRFAVTAVDRALLGGASSTAQFLDAALILALNLGQLVLAAALAMRDARRRRRAANRDQPAEPAPAAEPTPAGEPAPAGGPAPGPEPADLALTPSPTS